MILYENKKGCEIIVPTKSTDAVKLAASDLIRDLNKLCGEKNAFPLSTKPKGEKYIEILPDSLKGKGEEAYEVTVFSDKITVKGSDELGTVYGIYAILTKGLNVDAMYRFNSLFPEKRDKIEVKDQVFVSNPRNTKFRGWFINDEDLLGDFKGGSGKRKVEYNFYQNVMCADVFDMILESALRLELNLIIPSTLVDLFNPVEEALVVSAVKRGLYVSQHHIEPLGVSWFTAERYLKEIGAENEEFSFIKNEKRVVELWKSYAEKWAQFGKHVVWQVGLRGKADRAVWQNDPSVPKDAKSRGKLIEKAIETQWQIIAKALNSEDFTSTITLWMEGAELYGKGYVKLPKNCVAVFSDLGHSQTFGEDFFTVKRKKNQKYGVYYHAGYWGLGPHLAEGCDPRKMTYSYKLAQKNGGIFYSVLNVANVREMQSSASLNAELLNVSPENFDLDAYKTARYEKLFPKLGKKIYKGEKLYFNAIADNGNAEGRKFAETYNFFYHDYYGVNFPTYPATDGFLRFFGGFVFTDTTLTEEQHKIFVKSEKRFAKTDAYFKKLEDKIPDYAKDYFNFYFKLQTRYMWLLTQWVVSCSIARNLTNEGADKKTLHDAWEKVYKILLQILKERKIGELGEWKGWYDGERKLFYENITNDCLEKVKKFE